MWWMIFHAFAHFKVELVVLNAIGCGAFVGPFPRVPSLYATCLLDVLQRLPKAVLKHVIVCFPRSDRFNHESFKGVFPKPHNNVNGIAVQLWNEHSSITVAQYFAEEVYKDHRKVGLLNPSDAYAVMRGNIGMYFDGGHIALEEFIAVSTSILTMHRSINPKLWTNEFQNVPVPL